jgi:iron complex transport system permease protein
VTMSGPGKATAVLLAGRSSRARTAWLGAVLALLALLCALSVAIGTREVSFADILGGLSGRVDTVAEAAVAVRLPRTLLALLSGAALGLAGAIMQGVTRNPLADPGILGVNMGASLAVVIGIVWFGIASAHAFITVAIAGAGVSAVFVYVVGSLGRGGATPLKLALAGAATSVAFSSLVIAVVLPRSDIAGGIRSWQIGGVGGATFERIETVLPFLAAGFIVSLLSARKLNSLALGDELAAGLGENVMAARAVASFGAILLCGAATAICGPIGFVGLVVPHLCRLLVGVDNRWLLPFSALGGACLLLAADIVGRIVARPSELDVGIVTALVGAPFFIWIVRRCANCDHARSRHRKSRLQPPYTSAPTSPCHRCPVGDPDLRFRNHADARAILHAAP